MVVTKVAESRRYNEQLPVRFSNVIRHGFIIWAWGQYQMICRDELIFTPVMA